MTVVKWRGVGKGLLVGVMLIASPVYAQEPPDSALPIVRAHRSGYVIHYEPRAAPSVVEAAIDLRDYLARATGASLPIVNADQTPASPYIALGETRASRKAGLSAGGMSPDAFAIAPRGRNLFILGRDTAAGERLDSGGTSAGTANGVYAFLEIYAGVRWLMPGDDGADVPPRADIAVAATDVRDAPAFAYRQLPYMQNEAAAVGQWSRRQKLGYSLALNHSHNWTAIDPGGFALHPTWFAARQGRRVVPANRYKLETTNPEMVAAFAAKAIEAFRRDPNLASFSLSPSDGEGWSDSRESLAWHDRDPHGNLSLTPLILKFYNDVARIVGREFPRRLLCGYVYAQYLYPPTAGMPKLEPNVCLVVAASLDYGYPWFRPVVRQDLAELIKAWGAAAPTTAYYDLPSQLEQTSSAPTPPSARILGFVFSNAAAAGMAGIYVYGVRDWGYGGATNYVEAKLAWNPRADASILITEFYQRAYGRASGTLMQQLNERLELAIEQFYLTHPKLTYSLTPEMLREVYARLYPDIEASYAQALARCSEPAARSRLEMFGRNLILLRWNLRRENLIPDAPSPLARSDADMIRLLRDSTGDLATAPETRAAALALLQPTSPVGAAVEFCKRWLGRLADAAGRRLALWDGSRSVKAVRCTAFPGKTARASIPCRETGRCSHTDC